MARLGDVCEILNGYAFKSENYIDKGIRIIRISNVQKGYIEDNTPVFYSFDDINVTKYQLLEGDLLISLTGNVGRVGYLDKKFLPAALNQRVACIRIKDSAVLDKSFLFNLLNSDSFEQKCILSSKGVAQKNMSAEWLKDYKIPLPPLDEQRKIAAVLDKVSDLIAKRRQQLDKLDEMVKSRFVEMFGDLADPDCKYMRYKLEETCVSSDDIKCGPFGTQLNKNEYQDHGIAVWEIPQINSEFKIFPTHFLTSEKAKQLDAYSLIPGDIAMSRKGNVGRCALFPKNFAPGIIHSDVLRIRVDNRRVNPCFLMYQLHFSKAVTHQIEMVSSGAVMAGINVTKLKQIYIHIPAFDLQQQFSNFAEQVEKTKTTISRSLDKLETLKKALMQEYFGEKIC